MHFFKIFFFYVQYKNIFKCICLFFCKSRIIISGYLASIGVLYAYRYIYVTSIFLCQWKISTFSFSGTSIISLCEIYEKRCFHTERCLLE